MSLGRMIRDRRMELGITQYELADTVGITQAMLCQVERGTKQPSLIVGLAIADALRCTVYDLIGGEHEYRNKSQARADTA